MGREYYLIEAKFITGDTSWKKMYYIECDNITDAIKHIKDERIKYHVKPRIEFLSVKKTTLTFITSITTERVYL